MERNTMSDTPKHTNRLSNETSPYLLQHAHNPVDWYSWGEEALARAKREDKPILLSIGYSACHWCHVMERESFENEGIAAIMNQHFVNIKVDREERPDLDEIYMNAVQIMTRQGGWPMTMFLTPELQPFYGGTYFPPDDRYGRPGFANVLQAVAAAYRDRRGDVSKQADEIVEHLTQMSSVSDHGHDLTTDLLDGAFRHYRSTFDSQYGGFGDAPKFPPSMGLPFLLRYWLRTENPNALEMAELTLEKMARGGMYDQLGGGFHRYSTDAVWLVPHFEKMLYDNAQLVVAYLEAYQATKKPLYREIAKETLDYVLREMYDAEKGGFYSAQDADSEGVEGKFFVWSLDEVDRILGRENAEIFCEYYDITESGNFEGENILHVQTPLDIFAKKLRRDEAELEAILLKEKQKLFEVREGRIKPGLDDKILTSWNGIMIRGMAVGYQLLNDQRYLEAAEKSADFILSELSQANGLLLRTYRAGKSHLNAYLEDYSYLSAGLVALYEASFNPRWLQEAERLTEIMIEQFWDDSSSGFFFTGKAHESLIVQSKSAYDSATPSGTAMAVHSLLRLAKHLDRPDFREKAVQALSLYYHQMENAPSGSGQLLCELEFMLSTPKELAVVGEKNADDTKVVLQEIHGRFLPNKILALLDPSDNQSSADASMPLTTGKKQIDGKATVYVCENYACQVPTTDVVELGTLL
jgi:uncharacterized protein YyaL (SSP411 family)